MKKLNVGDKLFIEKAGDGWRAIQWYTVEVLDSKEVLDLIARGGEGEIEGLNHDEADLFVEVQGAVFHDDEGEYSNEGRDDGRVVEYDDYSWWAISTKDKEVKINIL